MARQGLAGVKKKAQLERRRLVCVDEAAFYLLAGVVRTYAPCGETPVLRVWQTRDHLSVMSGVTREGHLATMTRTRALTGLDSIRFLQHLYAYFGCKLLVIWDGATIHRSQEVKEFLAAGWASKIHLEPFPAYAPELNPDEGVWQHLKHVELRNLCCFDFNHLCVELRLAIRRVQRRPELIQSFFTGARLAL
jgi:transposase